MARLAIFTERYTIRRAVELTALTNFRMAAAKLGLDADFIFRSEIMNIPRYDGLLIRALTDPLNTSYVAARLAEVHGLRVIDEPDSIMVCCDKVNMYQHLMRASVPIPETCFLTEDEVTVEQARELFETYGRPLVLKAPNSSFSAYVEKAHDEASFVKVGKRFLRRADRLVVQQYLPSSFDWRVTILDGKVLFVVKYVMAPGAWRAHDRDGATTAGHRLLVGSHIHAQREARHDHHAGLHELTCQAAGPPNARLGGLPAAHDRHAWQLEEGAVTGAVELWRGACGHDATSTSPMAQSPQMPSFW